MNFLFDPINRRKKIMDSWNIARGLAWGKKPTPDIQIKKVQILVGQGSMKPKPKELMECPLCGNLLFPVMSEEEPIIVEVASYRKHGTIRATFKCSDPECPHEQEGQLKFMGWIK